MTLKRSWYHCAACGHGFAPRDRALGLEDAGLSPGVVRMVGAVGAAVSFEEGSGLLRELSGLSVPAKTVERTAEALGEEIAADEREIVAPAPEDAIAPTMYAALDGTATPMRREEIEGRPGKQEDGTSKSREAKLVCVFSAEGRDKDGVPVRDEGSVSYNAAIESAAMKDTDDDLSPFARRVEREAARCGFDRAKRQVALGDGAAWIWNLFSLFFPMAIQILDRFHVKERLHETGKAIFGEKSDLWRPWTHARCEELDAGKIDRVLKELRMHAARVVEAAQCVTYFENNRERMDYPRFRQMGLCTSSGVVEAGCKITVGARLKRAGMHWTVRGANAILALRCCRLSGRYEDFFERRAEKRKASSPGLKRAA